MKKSSLGYKEMPVYQNVSEKSHKITMLEHQPTFESDRSGMRN
jgi:hypothetical protein